MARVTMAPFGSPLVVLDARGRGLELTFRVRAGRTVHHLAAIDGAGRVDLLESVEGEDQDCWPPSPPWQQVIASPGGGGSIHGGAKHQSTVLLTGAAGASHWSASVEGHRAAEKNAAENHGLALERSRHPLAAGLRFDVACRAKSRPDWLGSTYRMAGRSQAALECSVSADSVSGQAVLDLRTVLGSYQLQVYPMEPALSDSCQLMVADELVRIAAPPVWSNGQGPTTFRWCYQISLAG